MEYAELLKRLTVDCKDDGKQFRKKDRIHEIKALLENSINVFRSVEQPKTIRNIQT